MRENLDQKSIRFRSVGSCSYSIQAHVTSDFTVFYYFILCENRQSNYIVVQPACSSYQHAQTAPYNRLHQLFTEIYLVYLWLGGALQLIKSLKSVCGHNKKE